ncbi:UvrD-helicase domain-containing protein [[Micrococcus luteus] ATCC 49442]|uniref:UvrD-helicase domain-containing protein n=1 Tax=[Micrococcus luteus] ATCC 49442 TaxID=2698727 RepID=UPI0013D9AC3F|nr:UvrD-helicase domain-containing protein [[Micrococcus luteus] ATCC 49442]
MPLLFPEQQLRGLNFEGKPVRGRYATGAERYFDAGGRAYKLHLSKLALEVVRASVGAAMSRLSHIYDEIYIDEVQDLTGCDLHILECLMRIESPDLHMVGDVRQSVFDTNPEDPNLKKYRGVAMLKWFALHEKAGRLDVSQRVETWRANQAIADFSDQLFPTDFNFASTISRQDTVTGHDGMFAITAADVPDYMRQFQAQPLRESKTTVRTSSLPFRNFGKVKGLTFNRVLIFPTKPITDYLTRGTNLKPKTACGLYVAVTRAKHSVAIVVPKPDATRLTPWTATQRRN